MLNLLTITNMWNSNSVSYTHLDVYKRQALGVLIAGGTYLTNESYKVPKEEMIPRWYVSSRSFPNFTNLSYSCKGVKGFFEFVDWYRWMRML